MAEAPTSTKAEIRALGPCSERWHAVAPQLREGPMSFTDIQAAGATFDDLVWLASALAIKNKDVERRVRLWLADCAARVAHIANDPRCDAAIVAARAYARGEVDPAAWAAARAAAWDAARAAAWAAARDAARAAARDAARAAAWDAEEKWQLQRLIDRMSNPEPADEPISKTQEAA